MYEDSIGELSGGSLTFCRYCTVFTAGIAETIFNRFRENFPKRMSKEFSGNIYEGISEEVYIFFFSSIRDISEVIS